MSPAIGIYTRRKKDVSKNRAQKPYVGIPGSLA
jgi:hypothetical protein